MPSVAYLLWNRCPAILFQGISKKMKGEKDVWRRRVGVFRIFYELIPEEKIVHVFKVERRTSKTY
jgi:mRNA-degrading endonuclease RelE of RelBE toxin-antitoxin system